ncbi:GntR family transcriptional regulator [Kitasatospora sp. NBC_00070]|uniref:GntR family transcriptional regulator n=1 Tax=Kitasatospora sp. NBC_00070 TaxID=2975962 RepID=UPI003247B3E7
MAETPIDRRSRLAPYEQVAQTLGREIKGGAYGVDGPLPGEKALAERFGVVRETVRSALDVLRRDGLVETLRGKGTFVMPGVVEVDRSE